MKKNNRYYFEVTYLGDATKDVVLHTENLAAAWLQMAIEYGGHAKKIALLEADNILY